MTDPIEAIDAAVASVTDPSDRSQLAAAVRRVSPALVDDVIFGVTAGIDGAAADGVLVGVGAASSPGVGVGRVALTSAQALATWEAGHDVVLVVDETGPGDEPAMRIATAIVSRLGGISSHAAIIARQWGVPAVCGFGPLDVEPGKQLLVDGSSGEVRLLDETDPIAAPSAGPLRSLPAGLATLLGWADSLASTRLEVLANADVGEDAQLAIELGAAGIGLCRSEHQFLGARSREVERAVGGDTSALAEVVQIQRSALTAVFGAVGRRSVTVRLLDAPLHEFGSQTEHNPMLGLRGVRLSVLHPDLLSAQVEGIAHAAADIAVDSLDLRVLVPMVATTDEMAWARALIDDVVFRIGVERGVPLKVSVGAMIETPRAALIGGALATHADFFSFGTNDLTQLTYGFSRDDVDRVLLPAYLRQGFIARSPFETLDGSGVVRLMALAAETGRAQRPVLGLSMCGEHGGDPASIAIAVQLGLDSVSVSPYRVPAARLAAAHAVLGPAAPTQGSH